MLMQTSRKVRGRGVEGGGVAGRCQMYPDLSLPCTPRRNCCLSEGPVRDLLETGDGTQGDEK